MARMSMQALTDHETLRMLQAARGHIARSHAMVLLAIRHGLRASKVVSLPLDHLNLKERSVRINRLKGSRATAHGDAGAPSRQAAPPGFQALERRDGGD